MVKEMIKKEKDAENRGDIRETVFLNRQECMDYITRKWNGQP